MNENQNSLIIVFFILYIFFDIPPSNIMEVRSVLFVFCFVFCLGKKKSLTISSLKFFLKM